MNAETDPKQAYLQVFDTAGETLPAGGQSWFRDVRAHARARFEEHGFPTVREEAWRYTNLAPLTRQSFRLPDAGHALSASKLEGAVFDALETHRLVFVNGQYRPELSDTATRDGVVISSLREVLNAPSDELEKYLGRIGGVDHNPMTALNTAFFSDGAYVYLSANAALKTPIHLVHFGTPGVIVQPRTLIVAAAGSQVTVIEQYLDLDGEKYFNNAVTEVVLEHGAKVEHYRVQQQGAQAFHVGGLFVRQDRGSEFVSQAIDLGGLLVRNDIHAVLSEDTTCTLNGLYLAGGRQHVDNHTTIEHAKPGSTSRQLYKGVLDGRARAVFNGRVVVHPDAQRSDAQQTNNNLLLSDDAEIDTKPELEIYADDVKCSHGATVGQLDPDQLFYLRARALDEAMARDLLTFAFANDVLQRFRVAPLRAALDHGLMNRLLRGRAIQEVEMV